MISIIKDDSLLMAQLGTLLLVMNTMSSNSLGNGAGFRSDKEGIRYLEKKGVDYSLDESGRIELVTLNDNLDCDQLLEGLQSLRISKIAFRGSTASRDRIHCLAIHYPFLSHLCIQDRGHVPVEVYECLKTIKSLRSVARSSPATIDPTTVQLVTRHRDDKMAAEKVKSIFDCTQLETLFLNDLTMTELDFSPIERLTRLKTLTLDGTGVTDKQLGHIGKIRSLNWLSLTRTKVTDVGLKQIRNLDGLQYLSLVDNPAVTDKSASVLLKLSRLTELDLSNTEIGDSTLVTISRHSSLRKLYVAGTRVTDKGLRSLEQLKPLCLLDVEVTRVSAEGVDHFRLAKPKCHVETNPPERMGWDRTKL